MGTNGEIKPGFIKEAAKDIHPTHLRENAEFYLDSICFQEYKAKGIPSFENLRLACKIANRYPNPPRALYILDQAMEKYWKMQARGELTGTLETLDQQEEEALKKKIEETIKRNTINNLKHLTKEEIESIRNNTQLIRETLQHRIAEHLLKK